MCGFFLTYSRNNDNSFKSFKNSLSKLHNRGPDATGIEIIEPNSFYMGHKRLSIQDLSHSANQPFRSKCSNYYLIFNGEIYNHLILRNLHLSDYYFETTSDTETLLALLMRYGIDFALNSIRGMFSFCFYDKKASRIFCARDIAGEKPFYYKLDSSHFVASSTLDPININFVDINEVALEFYFAKGFIPQQECILNDYNKLAPGHYLIFDMESHEVLLNSYWKLPQQNKVNASKSLNYLEVLDNVDGLLSNAISSQLISDRPVGCFLSGGIDSSIVSLYASKHSKVNTYTIGYEDSSYSEAVYAEKIAKIINSNHKTFIVKPEDAMNTIVNIASIYDEPFCDFSQIPTAILSQYTSKEVTVALTGDGGDEIFCGYNRYLFADKYSKVLSLPITIRKIISFILSSFKADTIDYLLKNIIDVDKPGLKLHKLAGALSCKDSFDFYNKITNHSNFFTKDFNFDYVNFTDNFTNELMRADFDFYLPSDILTKVDRASMFYSLECRAPILDRDLIEYMSHVPLHYKLYEGKSKSILRDLLTRDIPPEYFDRPKMGFGMPLDKWFRTELKDWAESILFDSCVSIPSFIDSKHINHVWSNHLRGQNYFFDVWSILFFKLWVRKNLR